MKLFQKMKRNPIQAILVLMVPVIVFFALIAPWLFTTFSSPIIFNENTGHIGNTFGIMSPFIAIAAVIVTYLAFKMQLDANEKMFDNSRRMQFERQFYELQAPLFTRENSRTGGQQVVYIRRETSISEDSPCTII